MEQDCIAAISTGLLPGGIGIVRISGAGAVKLCEPLVSIRAGALGSLEANRL